MLSKNSKPDTKVIGVKAPGVEVYVKKQFLDLAHAVDDHEDHEGHVFTVSTILPVEQAICGFGVVFNEMVGIWPLECYRALELPRCILECLEVAPTPMELV